MVSGPAGTTKLTDLGWRSATSGHGKVQINKNAVEGPLKLAGKEVSFGIGTHANSVIVYELPPAHKAVHRHGRTRTTAQPQELDRSRDGVLRDDGCARTGVARAGRSADAGPGKAESRTGAH